MFCSEELSSLAYKKILTLSYVMEKIQICRILRHYKRISSTRPPLLVHGMHQYGLEQAFLSLFIFRRFAREEERLQVMFFLWAAMMRTYDSHGKCCPCFISSVLPICIIVGLQKILGWLLVSYLVYLKCHIHSRMNNLVQLAHDFCANL